MPSRPASRGGTFALSDVETLARAELSESVWGYVEGGAGAETTARANAAAFDRWVLRPRPLANVRRVDLSTTALGRVLSAPFFVAPTAYHREVHPDGERGVAAAAAGLGVLGIYSTLSSSSLEEIAAAAGDAPRWFQLYLQPTLEASVDLARRAERSGYGALVVTVDAPVLGIRDRQARSGFALKNRIPVGNGPDVLSPPRGPEWEGGAYTLPDGGDVSWDSVAQIAGATELPLVVKGVLTGETARAAVEHGAAAVYVSNHGGRQLDRVAASLDALPEVVSAVGSRAEVYVDGGVRRGSDAAIALALGARAVGLGRPVLWALAVGGQAGVGHLLRLFGAELANTLLLLGRATPDLVEASDIGPAGPSPPSRLRAAAGRPPPARHAPR